MSQKTHFQYPQQLLGANHKHLDVKLNPREKKKVQQRIRSVVEKIQKVRKIQF